MKLAAALSPKSAANKLIEYGALLNNQGLVDKGMELLNTGSGSNGFFNWLKGINKPKSIPTASTTNNFIPNISDTAIDQDYLSQGVPIQAPFAGMSLLGGNVGGLRFGESSYQKKRLEKAAETVTGVTQTAGGLGNYIAQYDRSYREVSKKYPDIGKTGLEGKLERIRAIGPKWMDEFPETGAAEDMAKPFAQEIAAALEGRATDQDREIWLNMFPNALTKPSMQNTRNASNHLIAMQTKLAGTGKDISDIVAELYFSETPHIRQIAEQFFGKYPKLKDKALAMHALNNPNQWEVVK
jgi:hypothetical protein